MNEGLASKTAIQQKVLVRDFVKMKQLERPTFINGDDVTGKGIWRSRFISA